MSFVFSGPLPTLTSPVKVDHVFLLCFCLNSQNWTLESFGKSCFQPLNHCFYLLFSLCSAGHVVCPGKMPSVFPPPLPPPSPTSLLLRSLPLLILSLLFSSFSLSLVFLPHLILLLFLPLLTSFFLTSLHSLLFHHSFHPFLSLPNHSLPSLFRQTRLRMSDGVPVEEWWSILIDLVDNILDSSKGYYPTVILKFNLPASVVSIGYAYTLSLSPLKIPYSYTLFCPFPSLTVVRESEWGMCEWRRRVCVKMCV